MVQMENMFDDLATLMGYTSKGSESDGSVEWSAEAEAEWQQMEELPSYEDVLEWQGKGWLWE